MFLLLCQCSCYFALCSFNASYKIQFFQSGTLCWNPLLQHPQKGMLANYVAWNMNFITLPQTKSSQMGQSRLQQGNWFTLQEIIVEEHQTDPPSTLMPKGGADWLVLWKGGYFCILRAADPLYRTAPLFIHPRTPVMGGCRGAVQPLVVSQLALHPKEVLRWLRARHTLSRT